MNLFNKLSLAYLRWRKSRGISAAHRQTPLDLLAEYTAEYASPSQIETTLTRILNKPAAVDYLQTAAYDTFKKQIRHKTDAFKNKHFQVGALDREIDYLVGLIINQNDPHVLEIGVANGYSSAFIYHALARQNGRLFSIDLPRFESALTHRADRLRKRLAAQGILQNTGTLGDLNPGGVVPDDAYAGWLVPMALRLQVPNKTVYGNAFHILDDLPADLTFSLIVIDAMKGYQARRRILAQTAAHLAPGGVCVLDGSWVNDAFLDFCNQHHYPHYQIGRIGICVNRPTA